jgi:hypothetical protein
MRFIEGENIDFEKMEILREFQVTVRRVCPAVTVPM